MSTLVGEGGLALDGTAQFSGIDMVASYRRQVFDLMVGLAAIGVIAQDVAAAMTDAPAWLALSVNLVSVGLLVLARWCQSRVGPVLMIAVTLLAGFTTVTGLFVLNGGWDGTHLYPLLLVYALICSVGLYGSLGLTLTSVIVGILYPVLGKLLSPDLTFGVGADQSWERVYANAFWWIVALGSSGVTGWRVVGVAQAGAAAQKAARLAELKEQTVAANAEQSRLAAAMERARTVTDLARAFDLRVRTVVTTVAQTSAGIGARAAAVSQSAGATGERVGRAAALSAAVAQDTGVVALNAGRLADSLAHVRGQATGAAAAAVAAKQHVARSDEALSDLVDATQRVGKAMLLIGAIADQTNLLALNATIESARAGAAGRGFAVVAAEVKLLAQRSASTAGEINVLVSAMRAAGENTATALRSIGQAIGDVSAFAEQVSSAAEDQAVAVGAITSTVDSLNDKTAGVRAQVSDVAEAAEATSSAARTMLEAATALGRDAGSLEKEAGAFITQVRAA